MPSHRFGIRSLRWQQQWVTPALLIAGLVLSLLSAAAGAVPWWVGSPIAALCGVSLFPWRQQRPAIIIVLMAAVVVSTFSTPSTVEAAGENAVRYQVDLVFDEGGTATGSFVFDPDIPCEFLACYRTGAYSEISITVSPWGPTGTCATQFPDPRTYTNANLSNVTEKTRLAFAPNLNFWIVFDAALGATGPVDVTLQSSTFEGSGAGCTRYAVSGTAVGSLVNPPQSTTTTSTTTTTVLATTTTTTTPPATTTPPTTTPTILPETGSATGWLGLLAMLLLGLGILMLAAGRRRTTY